MDMTKSKSNFEQLIQQLHLKAKRAGMKRSDITKVVKQVHQEKQDKQSKTNSSEPKL